MFPFLSLPGFFPHPFWEPGPFLSPVPRSTFSVSRLLWVPRVQAWKEILGIRKVPCSCPPPHHFCFRGYSPDWANRPPHLFTTLSYPDSLRRASAPPNDFFYSPRPQHQFALAEILFLLFLDARPIPGRLWSTAPCILLFTLVKSMGRRRPLFHVAITAALLPPGFPFVPPLGFPDSSGSHFSQIFSCSTVQGRPGFVR